MGLPAPEATPKPIVRSKNSWEGTLAICTPCAGRTEAIEPWKNWLMNVELPPKSRLYLLDTSGNEAYGELLKSAAEEFANSDRFEHVHLHIRRTPAEKLLRHDPKRSWNVADAYIAAFKNAAGDEEFVFL